MSVKDTENNIRAMWRIWEYKYDNWQKVLGALISLQSLQKIIAFIKY